MKDITEMNFWETLTDMPNRITTLLWKLLSVKGVALGLAVLLIVKGAVTGAQAVALFLITVLMVIGGREADKWKRYFLEMKG